METSTKVVWSPSAQRDLQATILYLKFEWSEKIGATFLQNVADAITTIDSYPRIGHTSAKAPRVLRLLLTKHNYLYYLKRNDTIHVFRVLPTRKKPEIVWD